MLTEEEKLPTHNKEANNADSSIIALCGANNDIVIVF